MITGGHRLPNPYVVHCLGPVYCVDGPSDQLLSDYYRNAVRLVDREELISIAFPAISTGAFGYPLRQVSMTAIRTVTRTAVALQSLSLVRFVLYDDVALQAHCEALDQQG